MHLEHIHINNLRVFKKLEIYFDPNINIIYGLNGQGKTSILEAIYYLAITKSFRAKKDDVVLKILEDSFEIKGSFINKENRKNKIRIYYSKNEGKHAFINSEKVKVFSELVGLFPVILLSLDDIELTFGVPAHRRKFLDILLSQLFPGYLYNLQKYKKSVLHKNKLLSNDDYPNKTKELDIWNMQLAEYGSQIIFSRIEFIDYVNSHINRAYNLISGKKENISVNYDSTLKNLNSKMDVKDIKDIFIKELDHIQENEIKRQSSLIGSHRDDISFLKDNFPFRSHASQGENKSFLLALKILESEYVFKTQKIKPLLLLDDIFGELDNKRIENLVKILKNQGQTFITTTENNKFNMNSLTEKNLFYVEKNNIIQ